MHLKKESCMVSFNCQQEDKLTEDWETKFNNLMDNFDLSSLELLYYSRVR